MLEHANAQRLRGLFEAFKSKDLEAIAAAIPEEAVWRFPGRRGALAGEHRGREAIFGFLGRVASLTEGSFHAEIHDILANERWAVVLFRGHAERAGRVLDNPTCLRIRFEDGLIREIWEFVWDIDHVEEFWA
jgi:uncharacterized protein